MQNSDTVIIDIQFVVGNEREYYIKEIAILDLETLKLSNYIFKSKFAYSKLNSLARSQNFYNFKNINGLRWADGRLKYGEIINLLSAFKEKNIIVRGVEKKKELQKYLPTSNIIDLEMNKSLEICEDPGVCCKIHENRFNLRCATKNVLKIKQYINECEKINVS